LAAPVRCVQQARGLLDHVAWLIGGRAARVGGGIGAVALFQTTSLTLLKASEGAALVRVWVLAEAIGFAALVVLWQVFGDGKTFRVAEEQSVAVFPALHFLAGTDPEFLVEFFLFVLEEHAGAERFAKFVDVLGEADHEEFGDFRLRVEEAAALVREFADEFAHLLDVSGRGLCEVFRGRLVDGHGCSCRLRRMCLFGVTC